MKTIYQSIYLLIFLALAGMAWGGDDWRTCPYGAVCDGNGECSCLYNANLTIKKSCMISCANWAILNETTCECIVKKGHCPHCGALSQCFSGETKPYYLMDRTICFCPNGHLFWEKD